MKRCDARILKLLLPWLLTASLHWPVSAQEAGQSIAPPGRSTLPSRQAIKDCMNRARGAECLDQLFRQTLKNHSTVEALGQIARWRRKIRSSDAIAIRSSTLLAGKLIGSRATSTTRFSLAIRPAIRGLSRLGGTLSARRGDLRPNRPTSEHR